MKWEVITIWTVIGITNPSGTPPPSLEFLDPIICSSSHTVHSTDHGDYSESHRRVIKTSSAHHDSQAYSSRNPTCSTQILEKDRERKGVELYVFPSCVWIWLIEVLRERYVRDDIPCGYEDCHLCNDFPGYKAVLPKVGYTKHARFDGREGHYLVIDTNVVLSQVSCISAQFEAKLTDLDRLACRFTLQSAVDSPLDSVAGDSSSVIAPL